MSVRLIVLLAFLNISCTAVFKTADKKLTLNLSKYNDFAYFVEMDEPITISSQSKLSQKPNVEYKYSCYYDQTLNNSVNSTTECNNLEDFLFNTTNGDFSWTPNENQSGDYEFKVIISTKSKGKDITEDKLFKAYIKQIPWFSLDTDSIYRTGDSTPGILFKEFLSLGDKISIYKDSSCAEKIAEQSVDSIQSYRKIETEQALEVGKYKFYIKAMVNDQDLPCIDTRITYEFKKPKSTIKIFSNREAFAALKTDGSVVTWGNMLSGGNSESVNLSGGVQEIFSTWNAFAALKTD
ncbi:MAG: hypothetical protein MK008_15030, partial [Bdellovibrionales bacterium]|nr:hypothetical protein [Bdellovibrionales bacterium]